MIHYKIQQYIVEQKYGAPENKWMVNLEATIWIIIPRLGILFVVYGETKKCCRSKRLNKPFIYICYRCHNIHIKYNTNVLMKVQRPKICYLFIQYRYQGDYIKQWAQQRLKKWCNNTLVYEVYYRSGMRNSLILRCSIGDDEIKFNFENLLR